jgi:uncharacterized membrane protein HdeD (DUF308 family)
MLRMYGKYWWSFLIRGILATLFGVVAIVIPGLTLEFLAILLAAFLVADGVLSFIVSFRGRHLGPRWGFLLFEGLVGVSLGLFTLVWPGVTVLAIVLIIGFWALITGVVEILAAVKLRDEVEGEWLLGLGGILSILFSIVLFTNPGVGAVAMVWVIGVYTILFGTSMIFLGIRLRKKQVVINL